MFRRPRDVGIVGIEIHFPRQYVSQAELEKEYGVPAGKYTIGLGQTNMSFVQPWEDINSISYTVVHNLLEKYNIDPRNIGRLEVGTETLVDKAKSTKTYLMELFAKYGNHDIEGVTTMNACYGATNALFSTVAWMQSESWDGRLGIVVAADIAVYAKGNARPTGGAGAVAILIGPEAPIVIDNIRSTYMAHAYDFYKPDAMSEYPTVDGHVSVKYYHEAIKNCYEGLKNKYQLTGRGDVNLDNFDYCCFHSPFCKMVYRSFITVLNTDLKEGKLKGEAFGENIQKRIQELKGQDASADSKENAELLKAYWGKKGVLSTYLSSQLGNIYAGSLYCGLISLISNESIDLENKTIMMFSYGSGLASSMFTLKVRSNLKGMRKSLNLTERLASRVKIAPRIYEEIMDKRKEAFNKPDVSYEANVDLLEGGTYYLTKIDPKYRRTYLRKESKRVLSKNPLSLESKEVAPSEEAQPKTMSEGSNSARLMMIQNHLKNSKP